MKKQGGAGKGREAEWGDIQFMQKEKPVATLPHFYPPSIPRFSESLTKPFLQCVSTFLNSAAIGSEGEKTT